MNDDDLDADVERDEQQPAPKAADTDDGDEAEKTQEASAESDGETETEPDGETTDENEDEKPRKKGARARIAELTGRWRTAETDRDLYRRKFEAAQAELERLRSTDPETLDFDARDNLALRTALKEQRVEELAQEAAQHDELLVNMRAEQFRARAEAASERLPDFSNAYEAFLAGPCPEAMADFIAASEKGPELVYYLGRNPAEAKRLAVMSDFAQGRAMAALEARISAAPTARKTSKAPPPAAQIGSSSPVAAKSAEERSDAEMSEWYRKLRDQWS